MIKSELISYVTKKRKNETVINLIHTYTCDALEWGWEVEIEDFGNFTIQYNPPRTAHNPKTGLKFSTLNTCKLFFKADQILQDRVNASL